MKGAMQRCEYSHVVEQPYVKILGAERDCFGTLTLCLVLLFTEILSCACCIVICRD